MVDFRPLLFANALILMLLVSAGFANLQPDPAAPPVTAPAGSAVAKAAAPELAAEMRSTPAMAPEPVPAPASEQTDTASTAVTPAAAEQIAQTHDTLGLTPGQETISRQEPPPSQNPTLSDDRAPNQAGQPALADSEPEAAQPEGEHALLSPADDELGATLAALDAPEPAEPGLQAKPAPGADPKPTSATLVIRSNVYGDQVSINGRNYGSTRLDLELTPGTYQIVVSKAGHQTWEGSVQLDAGVERRISAELAAFRTVHYRDGTWRGEVVSGSGTYEDQDGMRYEGEFRNRQFHGEGLAQFANGDRYKGDWREGKPDGRGTLRRANGDIYSGQFSNGDYSGAGTLTEAGGDIYAGNWSNGSLNGTGSLTSADGLLYVGSFRNGVFHGEGALTYPDGRYYEGGFADGNFHGKGSLIYADGKKYQGQFMDGQYHGQGDLLNPNGSRITSNFRYGEPYGQAKLSTSEGEIFTARSSEPGICYRENSYRATQCPPMPGW